MRKDCIFILAGHCAGKSTLARSLLNELPNAFMVGGYHGADAIKDRPSLYKELQEAYDSPLVGTVILESAFVDNIPVVRKILSIGFNINAVFLNVSNETRGIRRNLKSPDKPAQITKEQHMSQLEAASLFKHLMKKQAFNSHIRTRVINAENTPEMVMADTMKFIGVKVL